jgi:Skp family chaperone for outer membrane proteins
VAGLLTVCAVTNLHAQPSQPAVQRPPVAPPGNGIAVIDINYIMKKYIRFTTMRDELNKEFEGFKTKITGQQEDLKRRVGQLEKSAFRPGTDEYKRQEEDLARRHSDLQVEAQLKQKEFGEREAKILYGVHQEIQNVVHGYCQRAGISLVLQFNGEPADPNNPPSIERVMRQLVVYQQGIDITKPVLDELNRRGPGVGAASRPQQRPLR